MAAYDSNGMWIVGNQLYVGYEMVHAVDSLITLCQQTCQHLHTINQLDSPEQLLDFAKKLNMYLTRIKNHLGDCTRELVNKRHKEMLIRCLERLSELCPIVVSSIECNVTSTSSVGKSYSAQNRDSVKQHILETVKRLVVLLQCIKNRKPVSQISDAAEEDCMNIAQGWLSGNSTILTNTGFDAIRVCITGGRTLSAMLNPTVDKGELLCLCSECELTTQQLEDLYQNAMGKTHQAKVIAGELSKQLYCLREKMVEILSCKILDDFTMTEEPIFELERAALIAHYKPNRDQIFSEKLFRYEEMTNIIASNVNMVLHLHLISDVLKHDTVKYLLNQVNLLGGQIIWAAKLLHSNPYSDVLKDHFKLIKQLWLGRLADLRGQVLSSANLRTYSKYRSEIKRYTSRAERLNISPPKQVKFVSSITVDPPVDSRRQVMSPTRDQQPDWESADKDLVQAARKLAMIMVKLIKMVRGETCSKIDLLQSARDIVRAADILTRLTKKLAADCTDRDIQLELLKICERIPTFSMQLKMLCTIKASSVTGYEQIDGPIASDIEATEMLLENARNLMQSVRDAVKRAAAASINIRIAANQYVW